MYGNEAKMQTIAGASGLGMQTSPNIYPPEPTIRENIDNRIARAIDQVERLKQSKIQMEKSGLLDMKISDLRNCMDY